MIVLIEWQPSKERVTVRGCWPQDQYRMLDKLEPDNIQNAVQVFEGCDHKNHVGFEGILLA